MKTITIAMLFLLTACPPSSGRMMTGAPSSREAVESFLGAARAQDLEAMSVVWGTAKGPARDQMKREELEKRELVMMCFFDHERYRVLSESERQGSSGRTYRVELSKGALRRTTNFYTVRGPSDRWYVENADLDPVKDLCRNPPGS